MHSISQLLSEHEIDVDVLEEAAARKILAIFRTALQPYSLTRRKITIERNGRHYDLTVAGCTLYDLSLTKRSQLARTLYQIQDAVEHAAWPRHITGLDLRDPLQ